MFIFLNVLVGLIFALNAEASESRPKIYPSDVVFMYAADPASQYDAYDGTVVGWGGRPRSRDSNAVERFQSRVEEAHKREMRYCGSVDFLVDFGGFIDFRPDSFMEAVTRDLDGNPLRVPWLWDHEHKGHPAYWFCTNNPEYQKYLRDQAERACLAPIDGLHIDDYSGSSASSAYNGGCFCTYCMAGFREYLAKKYSTDQLQEMGIEDIEHFDYGKFLIAKGWDAERYRKEHHSCPLIGEFQIFQNRRMIERIRDVFEHAEKIRGKFLVRSINSSASGTRQLIPSPVIDYFCGEVGHHAASKEAPVEPVFVYKMVEALNRRQTATASGHDWAWIKANEKPGLVRMWIAQTYAFGSVFMVPHHQWCYTQELGTHWWHGEVEDFAYLYQFVRKHRSLLDGTASLANVALIHSTDNHRTIREAAIHMTEANIPFSVLVAGNEELPVIIDAKSVSKFNFFIKGTQSLDEKQQTILNRASGRKLQWKGIEELPAMLQRQINIEGAEQVRISLRYHPENPGAPIVCHILNQNYDPDKDGVNTVTIKVSVNKELIEKGAGNRKIKHAKIHKPKRESVVTEVTSDQEAISFEVKNSGLWAIVEL